MRSSCYGCAGSCHGYGIYGGSWIAAPAGGCYGYSMPMFVPQGQVEPAKTKAPEPKKVEVVPAPKKTSWLAPTPTRAAVTIKLPADARLYAEGQLTLLSGDDRDFLTPDLNPEKPYRYNLKVEYLRDGQTVSETREIVVKAGERTTVEFKDQAVARRAEEAQLTASK